MKVSNVSARWALVNRNTSAVRKTFATRSRARAAKRSTEVIFDAVKNTYVR